MTSSEAGLIITAAMSMNLFQFGIRQSAEMENQMTSVDRIIEYGQLKPEASLESNKGYIITLTFYLFFSCQLIIYFSGRF